MTEFKKMHQQPDPLLIANVWDVSSAKAAEELNFKAIGTSSAAMAHLLGYVDGEEMQFSELLYLVKRIKSKTQLPLTVDMEFGYGNHPGQIVENVRKLAELGIVGINLEDSKIEQQRQLQDAQWFAAHLSKLKTGLEKVAPGVFLNVRTDTFLLGVSDVLQETKRRIELYKEAGADGIFVPCLENEEDICTIVQSTTLPVNVMCMPKLPNFNKLRALGVRRISMGNFLFDRLQAIHLQQLTQVLEQRSFDSVFPKSIG